MGDRVIVLDRGRIAQFGTPTDIYNRPASPNVTKFLNKFNIFTGEISGKTFKSAHGNLAFSGNATPGSPAYAIRYDRLRADSNGGETGGTGLNAKFVASEYLGSAAGLGYLIGILGQSGNYAGMFASVLTVTLIGFLADRGFDEVTPVVAAQESLVFSLPNEIRRDLKARGLSDKMRHDAGSLH